MNAFRRSVMTILRRELKLSGELWHAAVPLEYGPEDHKACLIGGQYVMFHDPERDVHWWEERFSLSPKMSVIAIRNAERSVDLMRIRDAMRNRAVPLRRPGLFVTLPLGPGRKDTLVEVLRAPTEMLHVRADLLPPKGVVDLYTVTGDAQSAILAVPTGEPDNSYSSWCLYGRAAFSDPLETTLAGAADALWQRYGPL